MDGEIKKKSREWMGEKELNDRKVGEERERWKSRPRFL